MKIFSLSLQLDAIIFCGLSRALEIMAHASAPPTLRSLFPDGNTVMIYPDDFRGGEQKEIIIDELVDRKMGHFSDRRLAILFRPSEDPYEDINLPVGYWTQVLGLGETPDGVRFNGTLGVYALPANTDNYKVGSLDTFWRSAENFKSEASLIEYQDENDETQWGVPVGSTPKDLRSDTDGRYKDIYPVPKEMAGEKNYEARYGMIWAVSQAASLRRIKTKNLHLSLGSNWASGGFIANMDVEGYLNFGGQQQFCVRNTRIAEKANGGAWSTVLIGCDHEKGWVGGQPKLTTNEKTTTVQIEKPFIFIGDGGFLYLGVPKGKRESSGISHSKLTEEEKFIVDNDVIVRVFQPADSFDDIQDAASRGSHIILGPGLYNWEKTLELTEDNQVLLGIGMATIEAPYTGKPCLRVSSKASGVCISGISLEASVLSKFVYNDSSLLDWGERENIGAGNEGNPGAIHDLYCFVGGRNIDRKVKVQTMVRIFSQNVVGDNLWLWRADHTQLAEDEEPNKPLKSEYHATTYGECQCDTGLEVYGNDVTFHGLAVEHTYKDMVRWHGKRGTVKFYQSEFAYDVGADHFKNQVGYRVYSEAEGHVAKGVGVYSYFRDYDDVVVESAISDHSEDSVFENVFSVWLDGYDGIKSVINKVGGPTLKQGVPVALQKPLYDVDKSIETENDSEDKEDE